MTITGPHDARLTHKQQRFISEYLIDGNGSAAYQRAGYRSKHGNVAEVCASQLLRIPKVKIALEEGRRQLSERTKVDAIYVETRLVEVVNRCCEPVPILDRQGNATGRFTFDSMGALKALELLAKRLRLFSSAEPEPGAPSQPIDVHLPPEVLAAWAARIRTVGANPAPLGEDVMTEPPRENQPVSDMAVADEAPARDDGIPHEEAPSENAPPLKTDCAQLIARLLPSSGTPPRPCEHCAHCGLPFRPQRTETHCCFGCVCRDRGKSHRVKGHTADCRVLSNP